MAKWNDLVRFIRSEFRPDPGEDDDDFNVHAEPEFSVLESSDDEIRILVEYDDDRSQVVIVCREVLDGHEDWVQVVSVIGKASQVDLGKLLDELGQVSVVCGAVIIGEHVVLRHSLSLLNLNVNEFTDPLYFIAETADHLESMFFGEDEH